VSKIFLGEEIKNKRKELLKERSFLARKERTKKGAAEGKLFLGEMKERTKHFA
jgi:hypothetical protein